MVLRTLVGDDGVNLVQAVHRGQEDTPNFDESITSVTCSERAIICRPIAASPRLLQLAPLSQLSPLADRITSSSVTTARLRSASDPISS
jgi:hypothetical protein